MSLRLFEGDGNLRLAQVTTACGVVFRPRVGDVDRDGRCDGDGGEEEDAENERGEKRVSLHLTNSSLGYIIMTSGVTWISGVVISIIAGSSEKLSNIFTKGFD